jgi:hypothetical protein
MNFQENRSKKTSGFLVFGGSQFEFSLCKLLDVQIYCTRNSMSCVYIALRSNHRES